MKKLGIDKDRSRHRAGIARWMNEQARKFRVYGNVSNSQGSRGHSKDRRIKIYAPPIISIYDFNAERSDAFKRTMRFLTDIKKDFKNKNCFVDFSETVTVTAAAIIVVYAAIEQAGIGRKGKAEIIWSKSERVNRQLRLSNLSRLIRGHKISYALDSVSHMPIVSSVGGEMSDNVVDFIQNRIYTDMSAKVEHKYGDAVSETINNVGSHAYPQSNDEEKKWWLICHTMGKKLYLAIYDTGVGIPKTVVERRWFMEAFKFTYPQAFQEMMAENPGKETHLLTRLIPARISDHELIGMSMKGDVSGTKKEKRGQGSKSILALVEETSGGLLWVFSNNGVYRFDQVIKKPEIYSLPMSFPGTLVQWNIELP
ncbi:hypothetical protein QLG12_15525 [Pseudomonas sp. V88_4]|uniref:hypothetical protein n=1 Tax=Pseudomonas sp. V88_4 TaxID=3044229 RepID=UPI00249F898B|nr:hypothetical protein [Pseudomonas sp. V88_4]MDI3399623.1 hypothetical protein [Pseudomonas sp. V88_4]